MTIARRPRRGLLLLAGVTLGSALPVSLLAASSSEARHWGELAAVGADNLRPDRWEAFATAGQLVKPVLIGVAVVLFAAALRVSYRTAGAFAVVVVMTNLSVQGVKHLPFVDPDVLGALNPLSGHVGLAAGVGLGWVVVARRCRGMTAAAVTTLIAGVSAGVVVAGWHTVPQVVCPLVIGVGWALVGASLARQADESRATLEGRLWMPALWSAFGVGLVLTVALSVLFGLTGQSLSDTPAWALALAVAAAVGSSIATVSVVLLATCERGARVSAESVVVGPAT